MKKSLWRAWVLLLLWGIGWGHVQRAHVPSPDPSPSAKFAVISDTHIGSGKAADELRSIVAAVNGRGDLDHVFVTGDITEKGRDEEFAEAKSILAALEVPWLAVPGNHDAHWIGAGLAGFSNHFGQGYFFVAKENAAFLLLNSGEFGHFAPEQLKWLSETFSRIPPASEIFVLQHHRPEDIDNWGVVHNLLRLRKSYVVCGHVHRNQILAHRGIPVLTVRAAISSKDRAPGFAIIENAEEEVILEEAGTGDKPSRIGTLVKRERPEPAPPVPDVPLTNFGVEIIAQGDTQESLFVPPAVSPESFFLARSFRNMSAGAVEIRDSGSGGVRSRVGKMAGIVSRPALADDGRTLYAADVTGSVFLIDVATGEVRRSVNLGERVTSQLVLAPAEEGRPAGLLAGTVSGRMYCLKAETLAQVWVNDDAAGAVQTRPLVAGGLVVFGAWDGHLHCLDASTGGRRWSWTENDNFYYSPAGCVPATDGTNVFVCAPDGYVSAVELATGKTVWRENHAAWESLGVSEDRKRLFIKGVRDEFSVVDAGSGRLLRKTAPAHGETDTVPTVPIESRGRVIYGARNGHVYMIDEAGAIRPLLYLGPAPVLSVERVREDTFAAFNIDGTFVIFSFGDTYLRYVSPKLLPPATIGDLFLRYVSPKLLIHPGKEAFSTRPRINAPDAIGTPFLLRCP